MIKIALKVRPLMSATFYDEERLNLYLEKVEVERMAKEIDLKKIVSNLSKLGVNATVTKSRIELLKVLTPPTQTPQAQN